MAPFGRIEALAVASVQFFFCIRCVELTRLCADTRWAQQSELCSSAAQLDDEAPKLDLDGEFHRQPDAICIGG